MANEIEVHDVPAALRGLAVLAVTRDTTEEDAMATMRPLAAFNETLLGLTRFSGLTPWECHPGGDELLYLVDGLVDVTVLTDAGPVERTLRPGSVCVVPRGLWHRQHAREPASLLFATAADTTGVSWADDPRTES
jgi:mannose-6-phosphate isomerase-like protein (cupin superfamily)